MKGSYRNGKIYKIEPIYDHEENEVYYGSTTKFLYKRISEHKLNHRCWKNGMTHKLTVYDLFDKYGVENCRIYLVQEYPCNSKEELQAKEGEYIKANKCVNKIVPGRTKKQYYQDNKERILTYRMHNETRDKETAKKWRKLNEKRIKLLKNQKYVCNCGEVYTYVNRSRHERTQTHQKWQNKFNDYQKIVQLEELRKEHQNLLF